MVILPHRGHLHLKEGRGRDMMMRTACEGESCLLTSKLEGFYRSSYSEQQEIGSFLCERERGERVGVF